MKSSRRPELEFTPVLRSVLEREESDTHRLGAIRAWYLPQAYGFLRRRNLSPAVALPQLEAVDEALALRRGLHRKPSSVAWLHTQFASRLLARIPTAPPPKLGHEPDPVPPAASRFESSFRIELGAANPIRPLPKTPHTPQHIFHILAGSSELLKYQMESRSQGELYLALEPRLFNDEKQPSIRSIATFLGIPETLVTRCERRLSHQLRTLIREACAVSYLD